MNGFDPGPGWREVQALPTSEQWDGDVLRIAHGNDHRYWVPEAPVPPLPTEKTITLDALKGAIFSATDENGYAQDLGDAIWSRL